MFSLSLTGFLSGIYILSPALAAVNSLIPISDFGENPSGAGFFLYLPPNLQTNPPILVNPHWCHGDAQDAFTLHTFADLADQYGYIVIYPDSPNLSDKCWDVSSEETLSHDGGGDSRGIASMVQWTIAKYNADASRVYATGVSSGAFMVNVLLGSYPDVFTAGSVWAGVPFGCFAGAGPDYGSTACARGEIIKTGAEWAAEVIAAYPSYVGPRPSVQVFHGTADADINIQNLQEEIKQWTTVLGLPSNPINTALNTPLPGWTKMVYGSTFEAYSAAGVDHLIPIQEPLIISFFNLATPGSAAKRSTTPVSPIGAIPQWAQCGGLTWMGSGTCVASTTCTYSNEYWSACILVPLGSILN